MRKFILFLFTLSFISTSSYAYHHENTAHDRDREDSFYEEYNGGRNERRASHHNRRVDRPKQEVRVTYKVKKGESSKKRRYKKHRKGGHHKQRMRHLKRRLSKLPTGKKEAALKEIERHHQEMRRIVGGQKDFPEFKAVKRPPVTKKNLEEVKSKPVTKAISETPPQAKKMPLKRSPIKMKPTQKPSQDSSTIDKESNNIDSKRRIGRTRKIV